MLARHEREVLFGCSCNSTRAIASSLVPIMSMKTIMRLELKFFGPRSSHDLSKSSCYERHREKTTMTNCICELRDCDAMGRANMVGE